MKAIATCTTCGIKIELKVRKDFESFTGAEMSSHYEQEHPSEIVRDGRGRPLGIPYSPIEFEEIS